MSHTIIYIYDLQYLSTVYMYAYANMFVCIYRHKPVITDVYNVSVVKFCTSTREFQDCVCEILYEICDKLISLICEHVSDA